MGKDAGKPERKCAFPPSVQCRPKASFNRKGKLSLFVPVSLKESGRKSPTRRSQTYRTAITSVKEIAEREKGEPLKQGVRIVAANG